MQLQDMTTALADRMGVLWDLDGVLVDTGELHFQSWSQTLPDYDVPFSREAFRDTFGMNNRGVLSELLGETPDEALLREISQRKEELFRRAAQGQVKALPGVRRWVRYLDREGAVQAIASSAPEANIDVLVDELDLRRYFAAIVSGFHMPGKPDPGVFLKAARLIEIPNDRCIVVEDAIAGVEAARRAGMKCIAVTTTNTAGALSQADLVVERLDKLPPEAFDRLLDDGRT